ncbi:unnamed protein product [Prunus armeniaca]
MQEARGEGISTRAASRVKAVAAEKITPPNSAYQFESAKMQDSYVRCHPKVGDHECVLFAWWSSVRLTTAKILLVSSIVLFGRLPEVLPVIALIVNAVGYISKCIAQIFKNALTVPILLDIINEEMDLAVNYLDNLTRVPRFDTLIMFLSSSDNVDLAKIWDEVLDNEAIPIEYAEKLDNLHTKYCPKR